MNAGVSCFIALSAGSIGRRALPVRNVGWCIVVFLLLCFSITSSTGAQENIQFTQATVGTGLDNTVSVPLHSYPGRGAASLPISLYWSSRGIWRLDNLATVNDGGYQTIVQAIYAEHSTSGWKTSLDLPIIEWPKETDEYYFSGKTYCYVCGSNFVRFRVARVYIHMPDGSRHELRKSDQPYQGAIDMSGTFYAVDGSRMRYDSTGANLGTLYMSDGTRYILNGSTAQYIDRNGNTLNYNSSTRQWTDTLGRVIGMPWPVNPQAGQDYSYQLPGFGGNTSITYTLRWEYLADALAPDPNTGQPPTRKPIAYDYLPYPNLPPTNYQGNNHPVSLGGWGSERPSLFISDGDEEAPYTIVVGKGQVQGALFNPVVLTDIILPNGLSYKFSYNIYGEIDKIVYPTGAFETYKMSEVPTTGDVVTPYTQTSRGVTSRKLSANGTGNDLVEWVYSTTGATITTKTPNDHANDIVGTQTETSRQFIEAPLHGNQNPQRYWAFGFEDARNGTATDERVYALNSDGTRGAMLRRKLTKYEQTTNTINPRISTMPSGPGTGNEPMPAYRTVRPNKEVSLILDTGGYALAKTATYSYDTSYQLTTGLDLLASTESQFADVDQTTAQTAAIDTISPGAGTIARSAETTYLNSSAYRDRNILGLATVSVVKDAAGNVVAKSETFYDESDLLSYTDLNNVPDYTDPDTTVRGNVTTTRRYYDIANSLYLESHAQYDECGNVRSGWNERGIQSQTEYSSTYKRAYATKATTAAPGGTHGSNTPFTSTSTFDYTTGLSVSVTDANDQITTISYKDDSENLDPLLRPRKVTRPDLSWTKTTYHDMVGTPRTTSGLYVYSETQMDSSRTTFGYQFFDALGRSVRSQSFAGGTGYLTVDTQYDTYGRAFRMSNPYTTTLGGSVNPSGKWTTITGYDALSRVTEVTSPDNTTIQASFEGVYTTVTDHAGRQRRQKVNALGQVVRLDEADPDSSGSLGSVATPNLASYYDYDTLGNLIHIQQGKIAALQHRYFKYDALSRITYERQVEATGTFTQSDDLLTGNSSWSRKLIYDETLSGVSYKGLLTSMCDARNVCAESRYDQLNRIIQVDYSDRTPAITNNYDQAHSGYYNNGKLTEVITASVSDDTGTSYDDSIPETRLKYDFDLMGRTVKSSQIVDSSVYNFAYKYNLGGQLTQETYPSGRVINFGYDEASRLSNLNGGQGHVYAEAFIYSGQGTISSFTMGNGAMVSLGYGTNGRLQLSDLTLTKNGTVLQKYEYKYGQIASGSVDTTKNNGQLAQVESWIGTTQQYRQQYIYDTLGRLTESIEKYGTSLGSTAYDVKYKYDVFGNREQRQSDNSGNTAITQKWVEAGDIRVSDNRYSSGVTYDAAGNITADQRFRNLIYGYDADGRQNYAAAANGSGPVTSIFDGAGQRVANKAGGVLSIMVYDAGRKLVAEYGATAPTTANLQYVTADYQGSTRVVTNTSGSIANRRDYLPFGEEIGAGVGSRTTVKGFGAGDMVRQKYAGMETDDATGMAHTLWRKQDSLSGRWTSADPYGGSMTTADPQSFNRYSYTLNDAVNLTDSSGLMVGLNRGADTGWRDVENGWWGMGDLNNRPHDGERRRIWNEFTSDVRYIVHTWLGPENEEGDRPSHTDIVYAQSLAKYWASWGGAGATFSLVRVPCGNLPSWICQLRGILPVPMGMPVPGSSVALGSIGRFIDRLLRRFFPAQRGILTGGAQKLTAAEKEIIEDLLSQGKNVSVIPRAAGTKTADVAVNGVTTELKTLTQAGPNTLKNAIETASQQGDQILINARNVAITPQQAIQEAARAHGNIGGLQGRVTIWTSGGTVRF